MRVLMLGWEFPPYVSGGLGTACEGLTRALAQAGVEITYFVPRSAAPESPKPSHVRLVGMEEEEPGQPDDHSAANKPTCVPVSEAATSERRPKIQLVEIDACLRPYERPKHTEVIFDSAGALIYPSAKRATKTALPESTQGSESNEIKSGRRSPQSPGGEDLFDRVNRFAHLAAAAAAGMSFDVVHANDWMTFPAGAAVAAMSGAPLTVHVHSTEFDRAGIHVDQRIYDIERTGMEKAHAVIAVSHLTRGIITSRYGLPAEKVSVVYNAIDVNGNGQRKSPDPKPISRDEKIVLFLGRITLQKGPEYFLAAARKVLGVYANVRFVMAGTGDMVEPTVRLAGELGIGDKVLFTGFLQGSDVERMFRSADLYVMPSVSEPFGIASLEAISFDVPVLMSRQSGAAEVLTHVLKADFWDIDDMANKIVAVLRHPPLHTMLKAQAGFEVRRLSWADAASQCIDVYRNAAAQFRSLKPAS